MKKMKHICVTSLSLLYLVGTTGIASAQDYDRFEAVERMTELICDNYQLSGSNNESSVKGKIEAEAELGILTMELTSGGFKGATEFFSNKYFGLRQDELAQEKLSVRACKMSVWSDLLELEGSVGDEYREATDEESEKYLLDVKRPLKILDGEAKIVLTKIGMQGPFKIATLNIEAPNRPVQMIHISPKSKNFPNLQQFEYRNTNYTVDIKEVFIEDQKVAVYIHKAE